MTKAISLDFWGTIAVFNPEYSRARSRLLADTFSLSEQEANALYKSVKSACDAEAEQSGHAMTPLNAVRRLTDGTSISAAHLLEQLEARARAYPPLLHPKIPFLLRKIKGKGITVGISSNTNFLAGRLVQSFFSLEWDFTVYSDELGVSKPSADFFHTVLLRAKRFADIRLPSDILHIGDNPVCDVGGAKALGMSTHLVNNPDETVTELQRIVADQPQTVAA